VVCIGFVLGVLFYGELEIITIKSIYLRFSQHYFKPDPLVNYHAIYHHLKSVEQNFSGGQWSNDFFELARHFMLIIYFLGILQVFGTAIYPIYLIPLCLGLWSIRSTHCDISLLLWTVLAYVCMAYYFIVTRNFLSERYVNIVVVLLLPIVALGFEKIRVRLVALGPQKTVAALAVALFVVLPIYHAFAAISGSKSEIRLAGDWLKTNRDSTLNRMATTDERVPFYAGLMRGQYEIFPNDDQREYGVFAERSGSSLLVLLISSRDTTKIPSYSSFTLIKEFRGKKSIVLIYEKK